MGGEGKVFLRQFPRRGTPGLEKSHFRPSSWKLAFHFPSTGKTLIFTHTIKTLTRPVQSRVLYIDFKRLFEYHARMAFGEWQFGRMKQTTDFTDNTMPPGIGDREDSIALSVKSVLSVVSHFHG
jgi:hypothetical protein